MIDLGLSKLALIGVVALVVIGPERLPKVARMAGSLLGRAQRYINEVKAEVTREMELEELRKMHKDVQNAASRVGRGISDEMSGVQSDLNAVWRDSPAVEESTQFSGFGPTVEQVAVKAKTFRKKKLARSSAIPAWYKKQNGYRTHVVSGAARVAKYRPEQAAKKSATSFY
jgi:sec-independent protein translocase protein TatB